MDSIKEYINNLKISDIPWNRMVTAYSTAENYPKYLDILDSMQNIKEMNEALDNISDFEHQSTLFTPAPFALVFLIRIHKKAKHTNTSEAEWLVKELDKSFDYYLEVCNESTDAEWFEGVQPLSNFSDMLDEKYLLPEDYTEDDLEEYYENFMPDDCFYSLYYYSGILLKNYKK
ncbi:MAG: hypothetical protein K2J37_02000 [Ruminococcus sp.]|nr:hypothetical protein [Ruminococcus sp.]MDE6784022.1 hypothetical protein [Ruminococcus sp.]